MSLVNDMLRDLEERRAAPAERLALEGLQAVDEAAAARRERIERLRRGSIWFMAVMLIAVLVGMMIGRVVNGQIPWGGVAPKPAAPVVVAPVVSAPRLLEVLPQHDARGLTLQLLLERSVPYQRTEESGAVSLRLPGLQLTGEAQSGRLQRNGRSLSWRVEQQGADVQVLLVGLAGELEVRDRLEPAGERWLLWIEVPLADVASEVEAQPAAEPLPVAAPAETLAPEPDLPAWATAPVAPADAAPAAPPAEPVSAPELKIEPYRPDALTLARQAIAAGDYRSAIRELEALQQSRGRDPEVLRWPGSRLPGRRSAAASARLAAGTAGPDAAGQRAAPAAGARPAAGRRHPGCCDHPGAERPGAGAGARPITACWPPVYQQTGQWQESAASYRQLVALGPGQATWQLGLAIALEQLDQPAEAARHYRLALQGSGLDDSARRFASERAAALGGPG